MASAVLALGGTRIAIATTYYNSEWVDRYTQFLGDAGLEVLLSQNFVDQGLYDTAHEAFTASFQGLAPEPVIESIRKVARAAPEAECIVVPGLPCRFLDRAPDLEEEIGRPVVSYYAIWWRCLARLGLSPTGNHGALLRLLSGVSSSE